MSEIIIGVYKISNIKNGRYYIGYSKHIERRFKEHKRKFKNNCHDNSHFQHSYNKYGETNFIYEIIHFCDTIDQAKELELKYLQDKSIRDNLYNLNYDNHADGHFENNLNKEELRKKISDSAKEKFKKMSPEERSTIYGRTGKKHTEETKEKLRNIFKGRIVSAETKEKLRIASTGHKRPCSEETKKKLSKINKVKKPSTMIKIIVDNIIYESITEAGKQIGKRPSVILWRLKSKNFNNYKYLDENNEDILKK